MKKVRLTMETNIHSFYIKMYRVYLFLFLITDLHFIDNITVDKYCNEQMLLKK